MCKTKVAEPRSERGLLETKLKGLLGELPEGTSLQASAWLAQRYGIPTVASDIDSGDIPAVIPDTVLKGLIQELELYHIRLFPGP